MSNTKFRFMDPKEIIAIIVVLIILGVGIFAFFTTTTTMKGTISTPRGNYGTLSANKSVGNALVQNARGLIFIPVSSSFSNVSTAVHLEAHNTTQNAMVKIRPIACANGTFIGTNNTYRVNKGVINGTLKWTWVRINYSVVGAYTSTLTNQSYKGQTNASSVGGTVFGIVGIVITISSIMMIVWVVRKQWMQ